MQDKIRFPLEQAEPIAQELLELLAPSCEKIVIAGSIRRRRPDVGDIELLTISAINVAPDLSGYSLALYIDVLQEAIDALMDQGVLDYRLNKKGARTYGPLNKLLIHRASGIGVDVFSTEVENWGMAYVVRTGPKEFNIRMMQRFRALGMLGEAYGGVIDQQGQRISCPDEETVFRLLGWAYVPPEHRQ